MYKRNRSLLSKVLFFVIFLSVVRNIVFVDDSTNGFIFGLPLVWLVLFFTGLSLFSSFWKNVGKVEKEHKEEKRVEPFREVKEEKKSEYDFDDEFAIDPRDYE
jgi:hypothetical protein